MRAVRSSCRLASVTSLVAARSIPCVEILPADPRGPIGVSYCDGGWSGTWRFHVAHIESPTNRDWVSEDWIRQLIAPVLPPAVREEAAIGYNLAVVKWEHPPDVLWVAHQAPPSSKYQEFGLTRLLLVDRRRRAILQVLSLSEFDRQHPKAIGPRLREWLRTPPGGARSNQTGEAHQRP